MRRPRPSSRPSSRNVVSLRDWQKMTGQQAPRPARPPFRSWHAWAIIVAVAALFTLYDSIDFSRLGQADTFPCTVTSVTYGDTFRCSNGTKVRLSAIAARENDNSCRPGHPCPATSATEARRALEGLALRQTLVCEPDGKSHDRITAWCKNEAGIELNCAMVRGGYAVRWAKFDREGRLCAS